MNTIHCSKTVFEMLKEQSTPAEYHAAMTIYGIPVQESGVFPFEVTYSACDVVTREEVLIPSGEWIHGAVFPAYFNLVEMSPEPILFFNSISEPEEPFKNIWLSMFK